MDNLTTLFDVAELDTAASGGATTSGVYISSHQISLERWADYAAKQDFAFCVVPGEGIHNKAELISGFAAALKFPVPHGDNWDAFADCLGDLRWLGKPGYVIVYNNNRILREGAPKDWEIALDVFRDEAAKWGAFGNPMYLILSDYPSKDVDALLKAT